VYRREFGAAAGDWRVIDTAFYRWTGLGHWQHQPDKVIHKLICDASDAAFKLKHSKEEGWQVFKPYELNSHEESAFKYSRKRLEPVESLPTNHHLRAFRNCTVDMRTGATMPHDKNHFLTTAIPYDYEPGKECPDVFRQFIVESFGEDMLPVIRAFTSMFLDPTAPYGRFPHLVGQSGGGKGTLGRFWNSLFGPEGSSSGNFADLATAEGRHQFLTGKSIFAIPDAGGYISGLRAFYELVDNGGMSGRALFNPIGYEKIWNIRFWVASVDHLQIENAGDGWARRAYPIPY
jgi:phage/plasmid-associated DNA primase